MINEERLARLLLPETRLRGGLGSGANGEVDVCIMQAVDWLAGGHGKTDAPLCADQVIRSFCIKLNDSPRFSQWRDDLKPFAVKIVGTNGNLALTRKRGFMASDWALRTIAPMAFEFWAELSPKRADEAKSWAKKLRDLAPVVDKASAEAGRVVAREARAYAADDAAYAAAYAAADAAEAAAYAVAAAAARSDTFARTMWDESLRFLQALIDAKAEATV